MTFSIIIPVYNVAPYLRECLDSVLAQTYSDWEAICVDDGSTDGSGMILDEYAAKDSRFRVIHQANAGVSAARNAALDVAQGEWICFADSDDYLGMDHLQLFVDFDSKADVNFMPVRFVYDDGSTKFCSGPIHNCITEDMEIAKYVKSLVHNVTGVNLFGFTWNKVIRTSLIRNNNILFVSGLSYSEDEVFAYVCVANAQTVSTLPETRYFYRWHCSGLTHQSVEKKAGQYKLLYESLVSVAETVSNRELYFLVVKRALLSLISRYEILRARKVADEMIRGILRFHAEGWISGKRSVVLMLYKRCPRLAIIFYCLLCRISGSYGFAFTR